MKSHEIEAAYKAHLLQCLETLQAHFPGTHCSIQVATTAYSVGPPDLTIKAYQTDLGWTEDYRTAAEAVDELVRSKPKRAERIRAELERKQAELSRLEAQPTA